MDAQRISGSVSTISWIPSEAVTRPLRAAFDRGVTHYDDPPPEEHHGLADLHRAAEEDRFRFANHLAAWIEVEGATIVGAGYGAHSSGVMGGSTVRIGPWSTRLAGITLPDVREDPVRSASAVRFVQSAGGRAALPAPRRTTGSGGLQLRAPLVWTTLTLDLHVDGRVEGALRGASSFPRHVVYDHHGRMAAKSGQADFDRWYHDTVAEHSPWGGSDTDTLTIAVESALERQLSSRIMRGGRSPRIVEHPAGTTVIHQGAPGDDLLLLLDGLLAVSVDGRELGEVGPGAIVGERAGLEGARRTATLTARTAVRVAVVPAAQLDHDALEHLSSYHRREPDLVTRRDPDAAAPRSPGHP